MGVVAAEPMRPLHANIAVAVMVGSTVAFQSFGRTPQDDYVRRGHRRHAGSDRQHQGSSAEPTPATAPKADAASYLLNNNLGGQGPQEDAPFECLAFGNVARTGKNATPVSMVFVNLTSYVPGEASKNGFYDLIYPSINVHSDTNVTLRAVFVDSASGLPVALREFMMTFLNLDSNIDGTGAQQVLSSGHAAHHFGKNTSLTVVKTLSGIWSFTANARGETHTSPKDALNMTEEEQSTSLALVWKNVHEIVFTLQVRGLAAAPSSPGRSFKFAGLSSLVPGAVRRAEKEGTPEQVTREAAGEPLAWLPPVAALVVAIIVWISFRTAKNM
eukprot:TRINITY_DN27176_c0_g1_i1.p1 TRINITY_DN27176_c0_g1~~TRINITY_DN27176_c0_g1_i1.p1  ORF type:complete len:329 (-),score=60.50 TRINITY_DN27176_c0_g1_i1:42-1028(-)